MLGFYLLIPLLTAIVFGVNHSGSARHMSALAGTTYWLGIILVLWVIMDLLSKVLLRLTVKTKLPPWTAMLIAALIAVIIFDPFLNAYSKLTFPIFAPGVQYIAPTSAWDLWHRSPAQLVSLLVVPLYWLICVLVAERVLGFPHYLGRAAPPVARTGTEAPATGEAQLPKPLEGLFADVPLGIGTNLVSIHAEDHYVRVYTSYGEALVRYRFSDALRELADLDGVQVHRSHWVRIPAIEEVRLIDGKRQAVLTDGRMLPVSRSYVGVLRSLGHS